MRLMELKGLPQCGWALDGTEVAVRARATEVVAIRLHPDFRKFMAIEDPFSGELLEFTAPMFGLAEAPSFLHVTVRDRRAMHRVDDQIALGSSVVLANGDRRTRIASSDDRRALRITSP
ncbi:hypothetical protein RI054_23g100160 [Pseudoscourfieldia marina]